MIEKPVAHVLSQFHHGLLAEHIRLAVESLAVDEDEFVANIGDVFCARSIVLTAVFFLMNIAHHRVLTNFSLIVATLTINIFVDLRSLRLNLLTETISVQHDIPEHLLKEIVVDTLRHVAEVLGKGYVTAHLVWCHLLL